MELFIKESIENYLKENFFPFKGENSLNETLKEMGYQEGKNFPTEGGIKAKYFFHGRSMAKYLMVMWNEDKLAIFVNTSTYRNQVQIVYVSDFEIPEDVKVFIKSTQDSCTFDQISRYKESKRTSIMGVLKEQGKDSFIPAYGYFYGFNKDRFESVILKDTMHLEEAPNLIKILETLSRVRFSGPASAVRYTFATLRKTIACHNTDKKPLSKLSEKQRKRLKITMTKDMFKKHALIIKGSEFSFRNDCPKFEWSFTKAYKDQFLFNKDIAIAIYLSDLNLKYSFELDEFLEFMEEFFNEFINTAIDIFEEEGEKIIESYVKRYDPFESSFNHSIAAPYILKELKKFKGSIVFKTDDEMRSDFEKYGRKKTYSVPEGPQPTNENIELPIIDIDNEEEIPF